MRALWHTAAARAGSIALVGGSAGVLLVGVASATGMLRALPGPLGPAAGILAVVALVAFGFGVAAVYAPRPTPTAAPRPLRSPIRGRATALNGPATKVPSHGMHLFGQTYAIDLVHEPAPGARPAFGGRHAFRANEDYPSFGEPVHAPAAGRVAIARDRARDHRARSNLLAYPYLVVEGFVRQSLGAGRLLGNHLVIDLDGGGSVVLAHLQRGSVRVSVGDRVEAGEVVARVGNSGNSSEPHLHLQLADRTRPSVSAGLPFVFSDVVVDDAETTPTSAPTPVVPEDGRPFHGGVTGSASRP